MSAGSRTALLAAAVALAVYLRTLAPGLTEIDAGELAAVCATLGIAHPSGYPLFSFLGRGWTLIPTGLRTITQLNVLSAVLCAGAVWMVARVVLDLIPERKGDASRHIAAFVAALAFGFHGTLWSAAVVTEVHALQMFLDASLLHALCRSRLWGAGPFRESAFLVTGYLAGLSLTNHLTSAMLLPGIGVSVWRRRREIRPRVLAAAAGLGLLGLSAYAFLPIRSAQDPILDWGSPETWEFFVRHVSGAQYRVWIFASAETLGENLPQLIEGLRRFSWPLLLLLPLGLWRARRVPGLLAGSGAMALFATAYPLGYSIHDIATYFLPTFLLGAVWIGLGTWHVAELLTKRGAAAGRWVPALALLPAFPLVTGWRVADRSGEEWIEGFARTVLETPRPRAVLLNAYWDVLHSPVLYLQIVEGVRPDVVLLDQEHFRRGWHLSWLRHHHPELLAGLDVEADRLQALVLRFERGEPYDPAQIQGAFERLINGILENASRAGGAYVGQEVEPGIGAPRVRVPAGLLFRLENPLAEAVPDVPPPWPNLPAPGTGGEFAEQARGYAARMAAMSAMSAAGRGDVARARRDLSRAIEWTPDDAALRANLAALEAR